MEMDRYTETEKGGRGDILISGGERNNIFYLMPYYGMGFYFCLGFFNLDLGECDSRAVAP
jgi:hypothetical protein